MIEACLSLEDIFSGRSSLYVRAAHGGAGALAGYALDVTAKVKMIPTEYFMLAYDTRRLSVFE